MLPPPVLRRQGVGQPAVPGEPPFWFAPGGATVAATGTSIPEIAGDAVAPPASVQSVTKSRVVNGLLLTRYWTPGSPNVSAGRTVLTFAPGVSGSSRSHRSDHVAVPAPA